MRSAKHLLQLSCEGADWKDWYTRATADIKLVCTRMDWPFNRFVDVLAIISPRVPVRRNIRVAMHYMETQDWLGGTIRSTRAAMDHYEETEEIRGPKTSAFAAALKGNLDAIVLDTWMAGAFEIDQHLFDRMSVRAECIRRIRWAANKQQWKPAELQAAVWAATVRSMGRNVPGFRVSEELTLFDI